MSTTAPAPAPANEQAPKPPPQIERSGWLKAPKGVLAAAADNVRLAAPAPDKLEAVTAEMAQLILACAPGAIRLQKELIVRWRNADLSSAIRFGINAFAQSYATGEPREATLAFLEKRRPKFE